jgi:hypothetical protein
MEKILNILGIAGSLRQGSYNPVAFKDSRGIDAGRCTDGYI